MEAHVTRMVLELEDLNTRFERITHFIDNDPRFLLMDEEDRLLMRAQKGAMDAYSFTLNHRIRRARQVEPPFRG
jgi:hypothetical protein